MNNNRMKDDENNDHIGLPTNKASMKKSNNNNKDKKKNYQKLPFNPDDVLIKFWYEDYPPLDGILRFAFYFLIWIVSTYVDELGLAITKEMFFAKSCQGSLNRLAHYRNLGFQYKAEGGIFSYFLSLLNDPTHYWLFNCNVLSWCYYVGLLVSAIGFGWIIPRIFTGVSFWLLFGIRNSKWSGQSSHTHYLAGTAMVCFCFAEGNLIDDWSVDSQLVRLYQKWKKKQQQTYNNNTNVTTIEEGKETITTIEEGKEEQSKQQQISSSSSISSIIGDDDDDAPSHSGAARKFLLFQTACSMFFAGLHKVSTWGIRWMDGGTIYRCLQIENGHWPALRSLFLKYPFLSVPLATSSVIGEIGAIAIVFSKWWRPFGILSFYGFHIGVYLLMQPIFTWNMVTYILLFDWKQLRLLLLWNSNNNNNNSVISTKRGINNNHHHNNNSLVVTKRKKTIIHPSMRTGAWIYTALSTMVFITSLLRMDTFPFYSWSLYNWHPSEPGNQAPFTPGTIQKAAHHCMTMPPFNPSCQNHGTTKHHDLLPKILPKYLELIVITGDECITNFNCSKTTDKKKKCALSVYKNWKSHSCTSASASTIYKNSTPTTTKISLLQKQLQTVLHYYDISFSSNHEIPKQLPGKSALSGLSMRVADAAAAAINEGNIDFSSNNKKQNLNNAASRFARHIRLRVSSLDNQGIYLERGKIILAIGLKFNYITDDDSSSVLVQQQTKNNNKLQSVMLGSSIIGETNITHTYSNHEIGANRENIPRGDWSEVINGIVFTFFLTIAILYAKTIKIWMMNGQRGSLFKFGIIAMILASIYIFAMDKTILGMIT